MKKELLFASAIAFMMAGCAETELEQSGQALAEGKGVKFSASIEQSAGTRAELSPLDKLFYTNWYADKDKIGIFYKASSAVKSDKNNSQGIQGNTWMGLQNTTTPANTNAYTFKASGSGTNGFFVAADDNNVLLLKERSTVSGADDAPAFRAYWPVQAADEFATSANVTLPTLANQTQKNISGYGIVESSFMYSDEKIEIPYDADDNSVSKNRLSLNFKRVSPIVYFKLKEEIAVNDNREYLRDYAQGATPATATASTFHRFGKLVSVDLTAEKAKAANVTPVSKLTYNTGAKWNMAKDKLAEGFVDGAIGAVSTVKTTLNLDWSNDAIAFMVIAPVDRAKFIENKEKEKMTATYTFGNVQLIKSAETDNSWTPGWVSFPSHDGFNLDNEPYLAYAQGSDFVLELNPSFTGNIADIFATNGELKNIKKTNGNAINKNEIKHFISKVDVTTAANFTAIKALPLTHVTLLENTTIPAEAFKGLTALTYLNLPKVTTVANANAFPATATFKEVYMGSFDFSDIDGVTNPIRPILLKAASLVKADIAAVASINAGFPKSGVSFSEFAKLDEINVKSGVIVGGAAFKDCIVLKNVQFSKGILNGSVSLFEGGNSQFIGCEALPTIAISGTVIPDAAFSGCTVLKSVVDANDKNVLPTSIGVSSFEDCTTLKNINLSNAATIGKAAFKGCTVLVGVKEGTYNGADKMVLRAKAVTHVSDEAFSGCTALKFISFANATTIGVEILTGVTCVEIEFLKAFTVNSTVKTLTATSKLFGTTATTKLFCNTAQAGVETNVITLTGTAKDSQPVSTSFGGTIEKKY